MKKKDMEPLVITVEHARKLLGLSRSLMYQAINSGQIPSVRIGRRILIPMAQLDRLINGPGEQQLFDEDLRFYFHYGDYGENEEYGEYDVYFVKFGRKYL